MNNKKLIFAVLFLCSAISRADSLSGIFPDVLSGRNTGTHDQLVKLAERAIENNQSVVHLLRDVSLRFSHEKGFITFSGSDLRKLNKTYSMGTDVMYALVPPSKTKNISLGDFGNDRAEIKVELDETTNTYFNYRYIFNISVKLKLKSEYGATGISKNQLDDVYGIVASHKLGTADVDSVRISGDQTVVVELSKGPSVKVNVGTVSRR